MTDQKFDSMKDVRDRNEAEAQVGHDLTGDDLFAGGDDPFRPIELPEVKKNGKAGVVYMAPLPAGQVLSMSEMPTETDEEKAAQRAEQHKLIKQCLVNREGKPLVPPGKEIAELGAQAYIRIIRAMTDGMGVKVDDDGTVRIEEGNSSSEAPSDASPTS